MRSSAAVIVALYVLAVLLAAFVVSGVVPRYFATTARRQRVDEFARHYTAWLEASARAHPDEWTVVGTEEAKAAQLRAWLSQRRDEMQRDAEAVGHGVMYVAPPPAFGGAYQPHRYFSDLFGAQSWTDYPATFRVEELATITHELQQRRTRHRRDMFNPWAWVRLAFERIVGFPAYILRAAGFGPTVTNSTGVRIVSAVWSFLVGAAGIAGFVVTLLQQS